MRFTEKNPPRAFGAAVEDSAPTLDCGDVTLDLGEQVTFVDSRTEAPHTDVTRKVWGYYLTRSCNERQKESGWRTAIIRNSMARTYVVMVSEEARQEFADFLDATSHVVVLWVDELD